MTQEVVAIAGFARTGSSLTMQMLAAGGYPVLGKPPLYEFSLYLNGWDSYRRDGPGHAVKILDLPFQHGPPPRIPQRFILLSRNPKQQALSTLKFSRWSPGMRKRPWKMTEADVPTLQKMLPDNYTRLKGILSGYGPVLELRFEKILSDPRRAAEKLAGFLPLPVDVERMVECVVPRDPSCYEGMLEDELAALDKPRSQSVDIDLRG